MGVTLYVFNAQKQVRKVLLEGVSQLRHAEKDMTLYATIPLSVGVKCGECLGFMCVDEAFRLFEVDEISEEDETGQAVIVATDAAAAELSHKVVEELKQVGVDAKTAVGALLDGTGWQLGQVTAGDKTEDSRMYYHTLWEALGQYAELYKVRIVPRYEMRDGAIAAKVVDVLEDKGEYRGRCFEAERDAAGIRITHTGSPVTVLYGLGASTSTGEESENLTIAGASWSKADGDPADKPAGQAWVEDAEAVALWGRKARVFISQGTEDAAELLRLTWEELQKVKKPQIKINATISDLEMAKGQTAKAVRMGDIVWVVPRHMPAIEARVMDIERDYIEHDRTKLVIGTMEETITGTVASLARSAVHTNEKLVIYKNKFHHDEELIQLNAVLIQLNAEGIQLNSDTLLAQARQIDLIAEELRLKADKIDLEGFVTVDGVMEALANASIQGSLYVEGTMDAYTVNGTEVNAGSLAVGGEDAAWKEQTVVTRGRGVDSVGHQIINFVDHNGVNRSVNVVIDVSTYNLPTTTLSYLGK